VTERDSGVFHVHHSAIGGFAAKADTYVKGRPDYPAAIEGWLRSDLGLNSGKTVLDLGAGTGKFTPTLLATGATVFAVELVPAMLDQLVQRYPHLDARQGSAEHIPLEDASVDAVVCAQSFHWFSTLRATSEIHRVLRRGGSLGLIWNVRDEHVNWVAALTKIMAPYEGDVPRYYTQQWKSVFPAPGFSQLRERHFSNKHSGSPEHVVVDRVMSVSFIASLARDEQERVEAQVRQLIATAPELRGKDMVTFPYDTVAFSCTKIS